MRITYRLFFVSLACIMGLLTSGCRQDREDRSWQNQSFAIDEDLARNARDSVDFVLRKSMSYNTQFSTFAANMDMKLRIGDAEDGKESMRISLGGQIRVKKDSILWFSCTKLLELGRMRITPDSLLFYSRISNEGALYTHDSVKLLPVAFRLIQCLFMRQTDSVMLTGKRSLVHTDSLRWGINGVVNDSLTWQLFVNKTTLRPDALYLQITYHETALQIKLRYFEEYGFDLSVSQNRRILADVQIRYTKPRWNNELSFPLSIPKSAKMESNRGMMKNLDNPF